MHRIDTSEFIFSIGQTMVSFFSFSNLVIFTIEPIWCAWDSNLRPLRGRHRRIHWRHGYFPNCFVDTLSRQFRQILQFGSGCGSVGRAVASDTRGMWLISRHQQNLFVASINCQLFWVDQNKEKEAGNQNVQKLKKVAIKFIRTVYWKKLYFWTFRYPKKLVNVWATFEGNLLHPSFKLT